MYRFTIGTTEVQCDTMSELLAVAEYKPPQRGERHGRPVDGRKNRSPNQSPKKRRASKHGAVKYWKLVHVLAEKDGIELSEARTRIKDPTAKARAEKLLK